MHVNMWRQTHNVKIAKKTKQKEVEIVRGVQCSFYIHVHKKKEEKGRRNGKKETNEMIT